VVNAVTGDETRYAATRPPQGERIAVIGAGPAGLTYAYLVAEGNRVTVFEQETTAGGAFRRIGKAPLFQEVTAKQASFDRYVESMIAACMHRGVIFLFGVNVIREPEPLASYDRIVIATGARYPLGLTRLINLLLRHGLAGWPVLRRIFAGTAFRNWLYHRARRGTGDANRRVARATQKTVVIGDAIKPGKSRAAIVSAFEAALLS
jgi:hypothetical protein